MDYKRILWTSLIVLAVGVFLLCYKLPSLNFFVQCLGGLFLASSVLNIAMQFARARQREEDGEKRSGTSLVGMLTAIASGALGLWMLLSPAGFATAMIYILGAMMILSGLFLIFTMAYGFKPVRFPSGFYILPALVTGCGIVMCVLSPETTKDIIVTVTAVTMIVFSVAALIEVAGLISYRRSMADVASASPTVEEPTEPAAETVEHTEIPEHSETSETNE